MRLFAIISFVLINWSIYSQNLVSNSSFEEKDFSKNNYTTKFNYIGQHLFIKSWEIITPYDNTGGLNNLYYTDTNFCKEARSYENQKNAFLAIYPHTGACHISSKTPCNKTLFQTKLNYPLKKGETYIVEFYYRVSPLVRNTKPKQREIDIFNKGAFGIAFTNKDYSDVNKYMEPILKSQIIIKPQIIIDDIPMDATKKWVRFFTTYTADKDYEYLVIGNFAPMNPNREYCNYYQYLEYSNPFGENAVMDFFIDDVSVGSFTGYMEQNNLPENTSIELKNIYFALNSAQLAKTSYPELNLVVNYLKKQNHLKIKITGHTDNSGSQEYNNKLSLDRANAVKLYLVQQSIAADRIITIGMGSKQPKAPNTTEENKAKNRRIEIILI